MLAHYHGQVLNYSELARSFGISDVTARKYIDILEGTFMVRTLQPWYLNTGKRLVKRPKIYIRDSGIFHCLMSIENMDQLLAHPKLGASWEGFALECVCGSIQKANSQFYFWRVHSGSELDLYWQHGGHNWGIEFKYADAPKISRSMKTVIRDLALSHLWVVYPGRQTYRLADNVTALPIISITPYWRYPKPD